MNKAPFIRCKSLNIKKKKKKEKNAINKKIIQIFSNMINIFT